MAADPVEAEAIGQEFIAADFGGRQWQIPLDVDDWPIADVRNCLAFAQDRVKPNHFALMPGMEKLLGGQFDDFTAIARRRRDLVAASNVFAAAVGIPGSGNPLDVAFGAVPRLLLDLELNPAAVEATLADLGVDYRDRWRFDSEGHRRLTLRQIHVRLTHAPFDSALRIAKNGGRRPHSGAELLLMDLYEGVTGRTHPNRPLTPAQAEERRQRAEKQKTEAQHVADYKARHQNRRLSAQETARANAMKAQQRREGTHAQADQDRPAAG